MREACVLKAGRYITRYVGYVQTYLNKYLINIATDFNLGI